MYQMVEYHRSEKYRADQGFSVIVAGLTNMKSPGAFKPPRMYKVREVLMFECRLRERKCKPAAGKFSFDFPKIQHQESIVQFTKAAPAFSNPLKAGPGY